jgi:chloramphenicol 3-O-phosphotransferase
MTATCIVLNGTSCSGKSSIAAALQKLWPGPLQVTGIDTFLAAQSERFFAFHGRVAAGFSWVPVTVDGQPAFDVVPGPLGLGMIKASHAYWAACAGAGLDQVIDDVWLVPDQPAGMRDALLAANTLWGGRALSAGHHGAAGTRARRPDRWHCARPERSGPHVQEV